VPAGPRTLIGKLAEGLPVVLSTPVTRIAWSGRDAQVETAAGTLTAKAVIVTASTNVLRSGRIRFAPDLPKRQQDAAAKLGLGSYDHIALEFSGNPLGLARDDVVMEQSSDRATGLLLANLGGWRCARSMSRRVRRRAVGARRGGNGAFAQEWLTKLFAPISQRRQAPHRDALERHALCARRHVGGIARRQPARKC